MPKTSVKSILGAQKKEERAKALTVIASLRGQDVTKLSNADRDTLLGAICILLNLTDKNHIIK